ncbi:copper amine oxidase N-terminal domain-containing protein [Paenibacillus kobensis]|uniref:copper amine oxidase N-terminal domain-containing protein n=1 Tax=Paenibacillus kobensis TaxID=59841 RepID=UPI000FDCCCD6|nr:copper amine oxidase N-terminal domain-containing protein [Paenibacillus kobensis]
MSKRLLAMLTVICLLLACIPLTASAAEAAEAQPVEIQLSVGSSAVSIDGTSSTIQKPIKVNGITLVPLSVITKAFGAKLKLENNKKITLTYNATTVVLTIGSNKVSVNGVVTTLPAEPKIVNGVTMVPVRVITQAFGANIALSGNKITITGTKANEASPTAGGTAGIDSDAGMTKIGDSYWGWSMQYPTDLTLKSQSDNGDWTTWTGGSEDPNLIVSIEDADEEWTTDQIREHIETYFDTNEIVLEKKTISVKGTSYERYVTKSRSGWFFEYRAAQKDKRVYVVMAGAKSESREALNKYGPQLDSFTISFDKSNRTLKDITKVVDGMVTIHDKDYGLQIKMPANWHRLEDMTNPFFVSDEGLISFSLYSAQSGETAEQWRASERENVESDFAAGYIRNIEESTIALNNGTGQVLKYQYSWDQTKWISEYDIYYITGNHKYKLKFYYTKDDAAKEQQLYSTLTSSLSLDTKFIDDNFGEVDDDTELEKAVTKKTSKEYGYTISLPKSWSAIDGDFEEEEVNYATTFGLFSINVETRDINAYEYGNALEYYYKTEASEKAIGTTVKSTSNQTINGTSFKVVETESPKAERPFTTLHYLVDRPGYDGILILTVSFNRAQDTEANRAKVTKVIESLTFQF